MAAFSMSAGGDCEMPEGGGLSSMREMFGPMAVDNAIRQAISVCWMCLPPERKNMDELASQLRRLLDRALENAREDGSAFGMTGPRN